MGCLVQLVRAVAIVAGSLAAALMFMWIAGKVWDAL